MLPVMIREILHTLQLANSDSCYDHFHDEALLSDKVLFSPTKSSHSDDNSVSRVHSYQQYDFFFWTRRVVELWNSCMLAVAYTGDFKMRLA